MPFLLSVCFFCRPEATPGAAEPLRKPTVLFKEIKLYLLDKDGTIYLDNTLFDGTVDFLAYVQHIGGRYIFLTNNSSKSADKYIGKLKNMDIEATEIPKNLYLWDSVLSGTACCVRPAYHK